MGRKNTRYCPRGHDKHLPHGTDLFNGEERCAQCRREWQNKAYYRLRKTKERKLLAAKVEMLEKRVAELERKLQ